MSLVQFLDIVFLKSEGSKTGFFVNWVFGGVKVVKKCFLKKLSVWLILIKVAIWVINYQKRQDIYKTKLQSTLLTFGGDWILHPNISELGFYTPMFGSISKLPLRLVSAVNCHVIVLMCFFWCQISPKTTLFQWKWCADLAHAKRHCFAQRENNFFFLL